MSGGDRVSHCSLPCVVQSTTICPARATPGSGRKRVSWIQQNTTVFAPMPTASESAATMVKAGLFQSKRRAKRRSFIKDRRRVFRRFTHGNATLACFSGLDGGLVFFNDLAVKHLDGAIGMPREAR